MTTTTAAAPSQIPPQRPPYAHMPIDDDADNDDEFGGLGGLDDDAFIALATAAEAQFGSSQRTVASAGQQEEHPHSHPPPGDDAPLSPISPYDSFTSRLAFSSPRMDEPAGRRPWEKSRSYAEYPGRNDERNGERNDERKTTEVSRHEFSSPVPMDLDSDPFEQQWAHMLLDAMAKAIPLPQQHTRAGSAQYTTKNLGESFHNHQVMSPAEVPLPRLTTRSTRPGHGASHRPGRAVRPRRNPQRNLWSDPDVPWHPAHGSTSRSPTPERMSSSPPDNKAFSPDHVDLKSEHPVRGTASFPPIQVPVESSGAAPPPGPEPVPLPQDPPLCPEQAALVDLIASGQNVFYTGAAGCGKSTVLRATVKRLVEMQKKVHVVAPTGLAARNVDGVTTWRYAGLTPDIACLALWKLVKRATGKVTRRRFENTDVLIIDEISMVDAMHLDRLDAIMRAGRGVFAPRNKSRPFGGVQVVFVGDFCQLPPVKPFENCLYCGEELRPNTEETVYTCKETVAHRWVEEDKWAFKSTAWANAQLKHVYLDTIHRQKEATFINILNKLRVGAFLSYDDISTLENNRPKITDSAVRLYSTREEVRRENTHKFMALPTKSHEFYCLDSFHWMRGRESATDSLYSKTKKDSEGHLVALRDHRFERHVRIKQGMLVALIINLDVAGGLCNGAQGKVIGWKPFNLACLPSYPGPGANGPPPSSRPVDPGDDDEIKQQEELNFCKRVDKSREDVWPEVFFFPYNGRPGFTRVIGPQCVTSTWSEGRGADGGPLSELLLCRTQIPLVPAWAMTIHKSQGMTLSRVIVDLAREFEEGQAYVALSRATGLEGLIVERARMLLEPKNRANKEVHQFYVDMFGSRVFGDLLEGDVL